MDEDNIVKDTLFEELDRNIRAQQAYESEFKSLPRGSLSVRMRSNRKYCYLKYRDGEKVITKYVGPAVLVEEDLREQINRRKEIESIIKRLKREQRFIEKALRQSDR